MNSEEVGRLQQRAAVHAALGDVARLRIVDTLRLGDASPSEVSAALGIGSNLLAFHLKALTSAGLISRHRSEGDRRRTYLRLSRATLDLVDAEPLEAPERLVFVCTANVARSHLAAALWRRASPIPAASAGTHPGDRIHPGAIEVAERHRLRLPRTEPRRLEEVTAAGDVVVTVCDRAHEELAAVPTLHWSIPDPARVGTPEAFEAAYDALATRVGDLAPWFPERLLSTAEKGTHREHA